MKYEADPSRTALLVIDMQNDFLLPEAPLASPHAPHVIAQVARVVDRCRALGIPVIYTAAMFEADGSDLGRWGDCWTDLVDESGAPTVLLAGSHGVEVHEDLRPRDDEPVLRKPRYSAFYATGLETILEERGIDTIIIAGVDTDICCESTARDAMFRALKVLFLADATATLDYPDLGLGAVDSEQAHSAALVRLHQAFCEVLSTDDLLERLSDARNELASPASA